MRGGGYTRREVLADRARINSVDLESDVIRGVAAQVQLHPAAGATEMDAADFDAPFLLVAGHFAAVEAEKKFVQRRYFVGERWPA